MTEGFAPPSQFLHLRELYKRMQNESSVVETEEGEIRVYTGHMVRLITHEMCLPVPYYSSLTQALRRMRCAVQLKRGGGSSPSTWQLLKEPTQPEFDKLETQPTRSSSKTAILEQQLRGLHDRVSAVEEALGELLAAMSES